MRVIVRNHDAEPLTSVLLNGMLGTPWWGCANNRFERYFGDLDVASGDTAVLSLGNVSYYVGFSPPTSTGLCLYSSLPSDSLDFDHANDQGCGQWAVLVSSEEPSRLQRLVVQPNPASDFCMVQWPAPAREGARFALYDPVGRRLLEQPVTGLERLRLDREDWPAGVYHAVLRQPDGKIWSGRILFTD